VKVIRELFGSTWDESRAMAQERFWRHNDDTVSNILKAIEDVNSALRIAT
jgi:hypothetical protein